MILFNHHPQSSTMNSPSSFTTVAHRLGEARLALRSCLLGALCFLAFALTAQAATYTVNSIADTGSGSGQTGDLRYCINSAISGTDTIVFDPTLFATPQTIKLSGTELGINSSVTIQGPGANLLKIDANHVSRVVNIGGGNYNASRSRA